mgnify:CR=1 FL=1
MEKVLVMLSTYNGEKYIREQLDSIVNQKNVEVSIVVRDDGSKDNTCNILQEYKDRNLLHFYIGENVGPYWSFMDLIYGAKDFKYYALADQDDVWDENKLAMAVERLGNTDKPELYYHAMSIVDEKLNPYDFYFRETKYSTSFINTLLYGDEIAGCTMVFNKALLDKLKLYRPKFLTMHDGWIHRVCLCCAGTVIADNKSYILYRQHGNNAVGMKKRSFKNYIITGLERTQSFSKLAEEMLCGYGCFITAEKKRCLQKAIYCKKIKNKLWLIKQSIASDATNTEKMKLCIKVIIGGY